jgi:hypothetical protein
MSNSNAPEWLIEVCERMGWDLEDFSEDDGAWVREGDSSEAEATVRLTDWHVWWELGCYEQDVDTNDSEVWQVIEALDAACKAFNAYFDSEATP